MSTFILKNKIVIILKKIIQVFFPNKKTLSHSQYYLKHGEIPWSKGYNEYKHESILKNIYNEDLLNGLINKTLPKDYGFRLDERIVEYPWVFSKLSNDKHKILDAGSTFNFNYIVNHPKISNKELTIFTYAPEKVSFTNNRISYVYGDLRSLPFKDVLFDMVVSQSTIEHIDMDNSMYGYDITHNDNTEIKSFEFINAIKEMIRVLKAKGQLLLTFPYGKFENHGFFQQFDSEMLKALTLLFIDIGDFELVFFKYLENGWIVSNQEDCKDAESYNPHTGNGKKEDNAAHSRAICCVHFKKY